MRFRELCRGAGVPYPRFRSVQSREELDLEGWSFPVILKPAKGTEASRISMVFHRCPLVFMCFHMFLMVLLPVFASNSSHISMVFNGSFKAT